MDDLKDKFNPAVAGIATGWLRRKGWAGIEKGMIVPTGNADKGEDEKTLEAFAGEAKTFDELGADKNVINDLIKRKLVAKTEDKKRKISITSEGKELVAAGISVEEEVAQLTSELLKSGEWKEKKFRPYNIHTAPRPVYGAKIHPYQRLIGRNETYLPLTWDSPRSREKQFRAHSGTSIHCSSHRTILQENAGHIPPFQHIRNFLPNTRTRSVQHMRTAEILTQPAGVESGVRTLHVRMYSEPTQQALTIKYLADNPDAPVKAFSIDRAYRRETIDPPTHQNSSSLKVL